MSQYRIAECDICKVNQTETSYGAGWPNWSIFNGITLNDIADPYFCPECTDKIADYIDALAEENQ